jgi:hypothetical protein
MQVEVAGRRGGSDRNNQVAVNGGMMVVTTGPSSVVTITPSVSAIAPLERITPSEITVIPSEIIVVCLATNAGRKLPWPRHEVTPFAWLR